MLDLIPILKSPPLREGIRRGLSLCPDKIFAHCFAAICNHLLPGQGLDTHLASVDQKIIRFEVLDARLCYSVKINKGKLWPVTTNHWDVCIRGQLIDFQALVHGEQDADTLFFQRKLEMQGDVETGLILKNMLDALEFNWPAHIKSVLKAPAGHAAQLFEYVTFMRPTGKRF